MKLLITKILMKLGLMKRPHYTLIVQDSTLGVKTSFGGKND